MRNPNHLIITEQEAENICLSQPNLDHILNKINTVIFCKHNNLLCKEQRIGYKAECRKKFCNLPRVLLRDISDKEFQPLLLGVTNQGVLLS